MIPLGTRKADLLMPSFSEWEHKTCGGAVGKMVTFEFQEVPTPTNPKLCIRKWVPVDGDIEESAVGLRVVGHWHANYICTRCKGKVTEGDCHIRSTWPF
ncbi:MAG: hypothetical protein WC683_04715 [bacterium]